MCSPFVTLLVVICKLHDTFASRPQDWLLGTAAHSGLRWGYLGSPSFRRVSCSMLPPTNELSKALQPSIC